MSISILFRFMTRNTKRKKNEKTTKKKRSEEVGIRGNVSQCSAAWCAVLWQHCGKVLSIFLATFAVFFSPISPMPTQVLLLCPENAPNVNDVKEE